MNLLDLAFPGLGITAEIMKEAFSDPGSSPSYSARDIGIQLINAVLDQDDNRSKIEQLLKDVYKKHHKWIKNICRQNLLVLLYAAKGLRRQLHPTDTEKRLKKYWYKNNPLTKRYVKASKMKAQERLLLRMSLFKNDFSTIEVLPNNQEVKIRLHFYHIHNFVNLKLYNQFCSIQLVINDSIVYNIDYEFSTEELLSIGRADNNIKNNSD